MFMLLIIALARFLLGLTCSTIRIRRFSQKGSVGHARHSANEVTTSLDKPVAMVRSGPLDNLERYSATKTSELTSLLGCFSVQAAKAGNKIMPAPKR